MMQKVVGNITWPALIARPILAILHAVYAFAEVGDKLGFSLGFEVGPSVGDPLGRSLGS